MIAMSGTSTNDRFEVSSSDSSLTFFAMSTLHPVYGKATEIAGFIEAAWSADGSIATAPPPRMHVEFKVESLRSGSELQDHEMWKLIDSKRFPKIAADLSELSACATSGRYTAAGRITLAGLARRYEGEFTVEHSGNRVTLDGDLKVDVRDFGLKPMNLLVLSVAPLVKVRLHLVASKEA